MYSNFKLKQSILNMTKFAFVKKIHTKVVLVEKNSELNGLGVFCYSKKKNISYLFGFIEAHLSVFISVSKFQSIKIPVELNSLSLKFFCYITWFD